MFIEILAKFLPIVLADNPLTHYRPVVTSLLLLDLASIQRRLHHLGVIRAMSTTKNLRMTML